MFFGVSLAAAGSCIYIRTRGGIVSRPQSQTDSVSNSYTYRTRNQKLVCQDIKIKRQKEAALLQGDGPDFGGPFTRMSHVRAASPRHAPARPGPAIGPVFWARARPEHVKARRASGRPGPTFREMQKRRARARPGPAFGLKI